MSPESKNHFSQDQLKNLQGRTALVTGATNGIGYEVAKALAAAQAKVILLSRKEENGEEAIQEIKKLYPTADVHFISCDLGNLKQVREVADRLSRSEERLDYLVADAGIGVNKYDVTEDDIERHFCTSKGLPPLMDPPRIVVVPSELHRTAPSSTKFANQRRWQEVVRQRAILQIQTRQYSFRKVIEPNGDRIIALATHPGGVHTGQQDQFKEAYGKGSLSTLWAAMSDSVPKKGYQGVYFTNPEELGKESEQACNEELGANLWKLSEDMIKEKLGPDGFLPWNASDSS
ncbi:short chain dehydrogenase reductase family protein [Moniliophthora roreri MCA 2997]|uniref:Short chain dehydrogenase reductase family protein n=1 Tax=Moniliophthora roreri (strain MCA 2997) TaxID=1381753 RepID=V2XSU8_MONRO|nr:short chain dehydrogenase reductase family protein [Moniliophthora roreri MCA 2997]